jgi:hypothetical protein
MKNQKRKILIAKGLAIITPGLGRALIKSIWQGLALYIVYLVLIGIRINPPILNFGLNVSLWIFFASLDFYTVVEQERNHT